MPPGERVRLAKRTSNLFRTRTKGPAAGLDLSGFDRVLDVDVAGRRARVGGTTTYEHLVDATLPHGLMPLVVPQLKTITLGGAVAGLGIESASFRNGLPHESVHGMEVLTGTGDVVVARPEGEHRDLFHGFPNSYGSLGYALTLDIELEPTREHVHLRRLRYEDDSSRLFSDLAQICKDGEWQGDRVDFVDGAVFDRDHMHLTLGRFVDEAPYTSDYTWLDAYHRSCRTRDEDYLTAHDYLWRWDTDWFWCSSALGLDRRWLRRLVGRRRMRSDNYFKVVAFERRHELTQRWDRLWRHPAREVVVQDVEIPIERAADFLEFMLKDVGALPIWLCPFRQRDDSVDWDLCPSGSGGWYVNLGFWTRVAVTPSSPPEGYNRLIERTVRDLGGFKSLYSTSFYSEDEFWRIYDGDAFKALKRRYDPDGRFPDMYEKCVGGA
jgi:FAD/FMN-containing dehydrogenase